MMKFLGMMLVLGSLYYPTMQWSGDGHRVIARIASEFLIGKARDFVADHICDSDFSRVTVSLIDASIYADSLEWSDELHFSHTPYRACSPFIMERDCGPRGRCIVTAIANYTMRASDPNIPQDERGEAIRFLVHLIADVHNPMHVGFAEDMGGNEIRLESPPPTQSLHNVWDYVLVNREQRSVGVFNGDSSSQEDNDGFEGQPWLLSDVLLEQIRASFPQNPGTNIDISLENVLSEEGATGIAARMASFTAEHFTCSAAYMNELGEWIENGASLTEQYLESRSKRAMELLKIAGIRLAHLLNHVAKAFSTRQYLLDKDKSEKRLEKERRKSYVNKYGGLEFDFDFDPNKVLYNPDEEDFCEELRSTNAHSTVAAMKKKGKKKTAKKLAGIGADSKCLSESKLEADLANKIAQHRDDEKDMFEGVDLNSIVLVDDRTHFLVTRKEFAKTTSVLGVRAILFTILFKGNQEGKQSVKFGFDVRLAGEKGFTKSLIARMLMKLRNITSSHDEAGDIEAVEHPNPVAPLRYSSALFATSFPPRIAPIVSWPLTKTDTDRICFYQYKKVTLFLHQTTLESLDTIIKTQLYNIKAVDEFELFFVDERLLKIITMTPEFAGRLSVLRNSISRKLSIAMLAKRRSILHEVSDIEDVIFGSDPDRIQKLKVIKWIKQKVFENEGFTRFHWSTLERPPDDALYSLKTPDSYGKLG